MSKQNIVKWLKRVALVVGIIPILLFLAFAGAVSFIDFNQYKPQIEQEVSAYTQREFKIEGEIEVSILPFTFHIGPAYLNNPESFSGAEHLLSVKAMQVELSLPALLFGKTVQVISLELLAPRLHLVKTEQGDNWSDIQSLASGLKGGGFSGEPQYQTATEWFESLERIQVNYEAKAKTHAIESPEKIVSSDKGWALDSLVVREGSFQFYDQTSGFAETLLNVNVLAFDVSTNQPFDVSTEFVYQSSLSERMYDVTLNGQLMMDASFKTWQLNQWHGVFRVRLPEEQKIPDIRLTTEGEQLELSLDTLDISVKGAIFNGLDGQLHTSFSGQLGVSPVLSGSAHIHHLRFKEWAKHLGVPLPQFVHSQTLSEGNGQFDWHWDGSVLLLNQLDFKIDNSRIMGGVSYAWQIEPQLNFDLAVEDLNFDLYRVVVPNVQDGVEKNESTVLPVPISLSFLQNIQGSGQLRLTNTQALGVHIPSLEVEFQAQQGVLALAPLDMTLARGMLLSRLTIDVTGEQPSYHWKGRINQLDLADIHVFPILAGVMVSRFDLKTKGAQESELRSQLRGVWSLDIQDAKISGLDVNALLSGELNIQPSYTELSRMVVRGQWSDGVYSARELMIEAERFSVTGAGTFDLSTDRIDTGLVLFVERPQGGGEIFKGLSIPMTYKGKLGGQNASDQAVWTVNLMQLSMGTPEQKAWLQQISQLFKTAS